MATTKRSKRGQAGAKGRAATRRAKSSARPRAKAQATKKRAKPAARKKAAAPRAAKAAKSSTTARATPPKRAAAKPTPKSGAESREVVSLKARFQRERGQLEKRLTEAVREIGQLRHHEMRATVLERQLTERDAVIARLQSQLTQLERRPVEPVYEREGQQTLALGAPAADVDEFEDEIQLAEGAEGADLGEEDELA